MFNLTQDDFLVVYCGNIGYQTDFETIFKSSILLQKNKNIKFVIAGSGPRLNYYKNKFSSNKNIRFVGWLDGVNLKVLMNLADLGLISYRNDINFLLNIPNKFPEYLSYGIPVLCGLKGEMGRITESANCGFVYEEGNFNELASLIEKLSNDCLLIDKLSMNCLKMHKDMFDSKKNITKFCNFLEKLPNK